MENNRFITLKEITQRIPYSKVHIYRLMQRNEFPPSIKLGKNRVAWLEHEVENWINKRVEVRGMHNPN